MIFSSVHIPNKSYFAVKKVFLFLSILLISIESFACSCTCTKNCKFNAISDRQAFVALVKVIEYSDFLEDEIQGYDGKMPFSMTLEIIKKYKGSESRKRIKIWGDNGVLCRPYIAQFKIGNYYLIAPSKIKNNNDKKQNGGYDFFSCWVDYLEVDYEKKIAYGNYSWWRKLITLEKFERDLQLD